MSGRQFRATPILDVADAVNKAVRYAPRLTNRKPTKAMKAFSEMVRTTEKVEDRKIFSKLSETTFYQDRYTIRRMGDRFEIWDAETHDVYGPYPTHADAVTAVRAL